MLGCLLSFLLMALPQSATLLADGASVSAPEIESLSLYALRPGTTMRLVIRGKHLGPEPQLSLGLGIDWGADSPATWLRSEVAASDSDKEVTFTVTVSEGAPTGYWPLRVFTQRGVSRAVPLAIEDLPQRALDELSDDVPIELPVAISGEFTGKEVERVTIQGIRAQHVIADLDCVKWQPHAAPVLELKDETGRLLGQADGRDTASGDPRLELSLPDDGKYVFEWRNDAEKPAGTCAFRLKLGAIALADRAVPPAVGPADRDLALQLQGVELPETEGGLRSAVDVIPFCARRFEIPAAWQLAAPVPFVWNSETVELREPLAPKWDADLDASTYLGRGTALNGTVSEAGQVDIFPLRLPGKGTTYQFEVDDETCRSPARVQLRLLEAKDDKALVQGDAGKPLEYTVKPQVEEVRLEVTESRGRGDEAYVYRVLVVNKRRPDFRLRVHADRLYCPADGGATLAVEALRSHFDGPILLTVDDPQRFTISPDRIPANLNHALVTLRPVLPPSEGGRPADALHGVRIVGTEDGVKPLKRAARVPEVAWTPLVPETQHTVSVVVGPAQGLQLQARASASQLLRGHELTIHGQLGVTGVSPKFGAVRISLLTSEDVRAFEGGRRGPGTAPPSFGVSPVVVPRPPGADQVQVDLEFDAPLDNSDRDLACVLRAELLPDAQSLAPPLAVCESNTFHISVRSPVTVRLSKPKWELVAAARGKVTGSISRAPGFTRSVDVRLMNLPEGFRAPPVQLPPDQEAFEIVVLAPAGADTLELSSVMLQVLADDGEPLVPDQPLTVTVREDQ